MINSKEISSKKFEKAKGFGGYRIDDVEDFMDQVAEYVAYLEEQKRDMEKKLTVLAEKLEEYRADEDSLRTALLGAQKLGDGVIRESKTKAEIILRDANIKAEKIINDAHMVVENEERALAMLKRDVSTFKQQMLELYRRHLEVIINSIPEERPAAEETISEEASPELEERTMEFRMDTAPAAQEEAEETPTPEPEELREQEPHTSERAMEPQARTGGIRVLSTEEEEVPDSKFGPLKFGDKFSLTRTDDNRRRR